MDETMKELQDYDFEINKYTGNDWDFGENNPYYNPDKCGLVPVCEIEWSEPDYSFDTTVIWKAENGKLYTASDSGCSCPMPFEDYHKLSDLTIVDKNVLDNLKTQMRNNNYITPEKAQEFFYKIRDAVKSW